MPLSESVLVILPTYNERENLPRIVPKIFAALPSAHVLVVDDSSPDGTGAFADTLSRQDSRVHVMHRAEKAGLGCAYIAGFAWGLSRGYTILVQMDADLSHDPAVLPGLISRIARGRCCAGIALCSGRRPFDAGDSDEDPSAVWGIFMPVFFFTCPTGI